MFGKMQNTIDKTNNRSYNKENKRSELMFGNVDTEEIKRELSCKYMYSEKLQFLERQGIMENFLSYRERLEISKRRRAEQIRKRIIMVCLLIMVFATTVLAITQRASADTPGTRKKTCTSYEIQPGDTLWSIAETYYTEECQDFRSYIDEIKRTNNMYDDKLISGNYLIVPYYKACAE